MLPLTHKDPSSIIIRIKERILGWKRLIWSDKATRNLFLFLILNFSFAFVELAYGIWTNSLGLISDSFHMFFDCTGLIAGLVASVITKWRADDRFSYGYVRAEVLAGMVNGLFLIFIAFFIMSEAVERAIEPPEIKHERLFLISVLGLSGNSHIMKGVFLHILADTLGSVGVIISAVLMQMFGWLIADPICSMFIAILIFLSVLPLLKESVNILMQRQPSALDNELPRCYDAVKRLAGVYSVQEPHFWTLCSDVYIGCLKLEVARSVDPRYVIAQTQMIFESVGVRQLNVQLDYYREYNELS
ncbi:hypothetical protein QAD02_004230 [Eretmocerus hayati]|uniref:Uncharacterized protein n=1 Tax=Eretmocerus hayati TaxID=131215 RepID=A0ACC2NNY1_9HYME|nr:hypothetical protein QAD02_004230 [Eretmocerus hayati]